MADLLHHYHGTASFLRHLRTLLTQIEDFLKRVEVRFGWLVPVYIHMHLFSYIIPVCLVNESHQLSCILLGGLSVSFCMALIYWRDYLCPLHGPHLLEGLSVSFAWPSFWLLPSLGRGNTFHSSEHTIEKYRKHSWRWKPVVARDITVYPFSVQIPEEILAQKMEWPAQLVSTVLNLASIS